MLDRAADAHGVDRKLLRALAYVESRYNPAAVSPVGAVGLLQLMPKTAAGLGVTDPRDPAQNADGGARYLASMLKKWNGSEERALASYVWGPARVAKRPAPASWPPAVKAYVANVLARARVTGDEAVADKGVARSASRPLLCYWPQWSRPHSG
jgi:soluble lytic murein transglycosylase-like protein